jgi:hypothetical protein
MPGDVVHGQVDPHPPAALETIRRWRREPEQRRHAGAWGEGAQRWRSRHTRLMDPPRGHIDHEYSHRSIYDYSKRCAIVTTSTRHRLWIAPHACRSPPGAHMRRPPNAQTLVNVTRVTPHPSLFASQGEGLCTSSAVCFSEEVGRDLAGTPMLSHLLHRQMFSPISPSAPCDLFTV